MEALSGSVADLLQTSRALYSSVSSILSSSSSSATTAIRSSAYFLSATLKQRVLPHAHASTDISRRF
jgi:hypothetical protein